MAGEKGLTEYEQEIADAYAKSGEFPDDAQAARNLAYLIEIGDVKEQTKTKGKAKGGAKS